MRTSIALVTFSVLVVDDDESIREALCEILESAGHEVCVVASGLSAKKKLESTSFDVILLDIRIPDFDGFALHEEIQQRCPDLSGRVVFVTGDTLTSALLEAADECHCSVIEEPFLPDDVRRIVVETAATAQRAVKLTGHW